MEAAETTVYSHPAFLVHWCPGEPPPKGFEACWSPVEPLLELLRSHTPRPYVLALHRREFDALLACDDFCQREPVAGSTGRRSLDLLSPPHEEPKRRMCRVLGVRDVYIVEPSADCAVLAKEPFRG